MNETTKLAAHTFEPWATRDGQRVLASDSHWREPLKWNRKAEAAGVRERVFCASLADVFEEWQGPIVDSKGRQLWKDASLAPGSGHHGGGYIFTEHSMLGRDRIPATMADIRRDLFGLIDQTPNLDWLLLTKRPQNIRRMIPVFGPQTFGGDSVNSICGQPYGYRENVWLGTSISNQQTADKAVPELLKCRDLSPVLFLSIEPLTGPVDLSEFLFERCDCLNGCQECQGTGLTNTREGIWVIVGGESGPNARPCDVAWIESIVEQCTAASVPCWVKQLGSKPALNVDSDIPTRPIELADSKGADPAEWPEHLRVQQIPEVTR